MAKKAKGKVSSKKSASKRTPKNKRIPTKYQKFQTILSEYKKESNIDFKGKSFNKVASSIWKSNKEMPLSAIRGGIDILFDKYSGINPPVDISTIRENINYWAIRDVVLNLDSSIIIEIDNSSIQGIPNYEGKAGDFISSGSANSINRALNSHMNSNYGRSAIERYIVYNVEIQDSGILVFKLGGDSIKPDKFEPQQEPIKNPVILELPKKEKKEEESADKIKLKIVKDKLKLEKKRESRLLQQEKTKKQEEKVLKSKIKLADKAIELKKAGFTKKEILRILGK